MAQHVFAWLAGYGQCVMPWAPYRLERLPGNDRAVLCTRTGVWGSSRVIVEAPADGGPLTIRRLGWSPFRQNVVEVLPDKARPHLPSPPAQGWQLQCELFVTAWPSGFAMRSVDTFPPPFDLEGPRDSYLWIQGPVTASELPPLGEMKTDEQELVALLEGARGPIAEFRYEFDGQPHLMFQSVIAYLDEQALVVTGQCHPEERDLTLRGVRQLADSLQACPPPADVAPAPAG